MTKGLILIDKSKNITSFKEISKIRAKTGIKRVGHTGTLDPFATGLLIVAFGKATKLLKYSVNDYKEYEAVMKLGASTDTFDCEGNISEKNDHFTFDKNLFEKVLLNYRGIIKQRPPIYSAIKINGKKAYDLARNNVCFELPEREINITKLEIISIDLPYIKFTVGCSSGTYIRSITDSIGRDTGYFAHLTDLRRTACGDFSIKDSIPVDCYDPINDTKNELELIKAFPELKIKTNNIKNIRNGIIPDENWFDDYNILNKNGLYKIIDNESELIAVINYDSQLKTITYDMVY